MGAGNSKGTECALNVKMTEAVREENGQPKESLKERQQMINRMLTFNSHIAEYCSSCHDVPKILMLLPSYRERCFRARYQVLHDVTNLIGPSVGLSITVEDDNIKIYKDVPKAL